RARVCQTAQGARASLRGRGGEQDRGNLSGAAGRARATHRCTRRPYLASFRMKITIEKKPLAIIADDEDLGRVLLAESVDEVGLESLAFGNGTDALAAALSHEVTIVLLDVDMPGLDGFEVCRRLRAEARFANVPIVMVTGHEDSLAISRAFEAGATDFV